MQQSIKSFAENSTTKEKCGNQKNNGFCITTFSFQLIIFENLTEVVEHNFNVCVRQQTKKKKIYEMTQQEGLISSYDIHNDTQHSRSTRISTSEYQGAFDAGTSCANDSAMSIPLDMNDNDHTSIGVAQASDQPGQIQSTNVYLSLAEKFKPGSMKGAIVTVVITTIGAGILALLSFTATVI